jgi:Transaldolase/Fructose-6-phosphate aldolase
MAATVTINDVLDGHVGLDIECLDRIYLNGYVPNLQMGGQVVSFLTAHLGNPIPSPVILEKIGTAFRRAVASFAEANQIPVVRFAKNDRKIEVMRPLSVWLDDLSRERLQTGNLQDLVDNHSVVGVTTNPSIFQAALSKGNAYDDQVKELAERGADVDATIRTVTTDDVRNAVCPPSPVASHFRCKCGLM